MRKDVIFKFYFKEKLEGIGKRSEELSREEDWKLWKVG